MLKKLAEKDDKWRSIALKITEGDQNLADEIVNDMYIRRYDNDRGQEITDYYVVLTMKSIYLNYKKTRKTVPTDDIIIPYEDNKFEPEDGDEEILRAYSKLSYIERELLELSYHYSLREIEKQFKINYGYVHRVVTGARKKVLGDRISEYQNQRLKHMNRSKGLGDTIAKITTALGIKKLVSKVTKNCGCDKRQELLNEKFRYKLKPRCMTPEELLEYGQFIKTRSFTIESQGKMKGTVSKEEVDLVYRMFDSIFGFKSTRPTCSSCSGAAKRVIDMVQKLDTVYIVNKK